MNRFRILKWSRVLPAKFISWIISIGGGLRLSVCCPVHCDGSGLNLTEPILFDLEIEEGSLFSGKKISALGLPSGCLLIRYVLDGKQYVPTADTFLEDPMRTNAIFAPEAKESTTMIKSDFKISDRLQGQDAAR